MDITDSPLNSSRSPIREASESPAVVENGTSNSAASDFTTGNGGSLFVGKLAYDCRTRELEELFGKYGRITRCDIKRGKTTIYFYNFLI